MSARADFVFFQQTAQLSKIDAVRSSVPGSLLSTGTLSGQGSNLRRLLLSRNLDRPMLQHVLSKAGIPFIAFKYAENSGQMQPIREQAGTFADSIKLWSAA